MKNKVSSQPITSLASIRAMNKLLFIHRRTLHQIPDRETFYAELQKDYLEAARILIKDPKSHSEQIKDLEVISNAVKKFHCLSPEGYATKVKLAEAYVGLFSTLCRKHGHGFTPRIAIDQDTAVRGFNCLGKAAAFGAFMKFHDIDVKFGAVYDHAVALVKIDGNVYLFDPTGWKFKLLHGRFTRHAGYLWYVADPADGIEYNVLPVQDFWEGVTNSIFDALEFLKQETTSDDSWRLRYTKKEREVIRLNDPRRSYRERIISCDWGDARKKLFSYIEGYYQDYSIEILDEIVHIKHLRHRNDIINKFDDATRLAFHAAAEKNGTCKEFHEEYIPKMKPYASQILFFLREGESFGGHVPELVENYFRALRSSITEPEVLKHAISRMETKLAA